MGPRSRNGHSAAIARVSDSSDGARRVVAGKGFDEAGEHAADGLASVAGHLRARIGRALRLRLAPEIVFKPDESIARAARIETLLSQLKDAPGRPSSEDDGD